MIKKITFFFIFLLLSIFLISPTYPELQKEKFVIALIPEKNIFEQRRRYMPFACWAVYTKEADIGVAKNHIFNSLAKNILNFKESMLILAKSLEVSFNGLGGQKDLPLELKAKLKNFT
jgi:ABC-type phosphate/phosphonate transport system substrate-binding protein